MQLVTLMMDNYQVGFISCLLILLASTSRKHIDFVEASLIVGLPREQKLINNHFQRNTNNGSFDTRNQQNYTAFAGYGTIVNKAFLGIQGRLNIWSPIVTPGDFSTATIRVYNGRNIQLVAGWMVNPEVFHDQHPRIFASYLNKDLGREVCYTFNPNCVGFSITRHPIFTRPINQTSVYGGVQYLYDVVIIQDHSTKNWLLKINNAIVGHWDHSLVSALDDGASALSWTAVVYKSGNSANPTPMGSGKPPQEGYGKASFIKELKYINKTWSVINAGNIQKHESHPNQYRVSPLLYSPGHLIHFYYGGS